MEESVFLLNPPELYFRWRIPSEIAINSEWIDDFRALIMLKKTRMGQEERERGRALIGGILRRSDELSCRIILLLFFFFFW